MFTTYIPRFALSYSIKISSSDDKTEVLTRWQKALQIFIDKIYEAIIKANSSGFYPSPQQIAPLISAHTPSAFAAAEYVNKMIAMQLLSIDELRQAESINEDDAGLQVEEDIRNRLDNEFETFEKWQDKVVLAFSKGPQRRNAIAKIAAEAFSSFIEQIEPIRREEPFGF